MYFPDIAGLEDRRSTHKARIRIIAHTLNRRAAVQSV